MIRASEIVSYVYCRRAWQLEQESDASLAKKTQFSRGIAYHRDHYRKLKQARTYRKIALLLLFGAISLVTFWLVYSS